MGICEVLLLNCSKKDRIGACIFIVATGVTSIFCLAFSFYSIYQLTEKFQRKRYYVPVFFLNMVMNFLVTYLMFYDLNFKVIRI